MNKKGIQLQWVSSDTILTKKSFWKHLSKLDQTSNYFSNLEDVYENWKQNLEFPSNSFQKTTFRFINDATHLIKLLRNLSFGSGIEIGGKLVHMMHWVPIFLDIMKYPHKSISMESSFGKCLKHINKFLDEREKSNLKMVSKHFNEEIKRIEKSQEKEKEKENKRQKFKIGRKEIDLRWLCPVDLMDHTPVKGVLFISEDIKNFLEKEKRINEPAYYVNNFYFIYFYFYFYLFIFNYIY